MAAGDYRSCDVCGGEAFYDMALDYATVEDRPGTVPVRYAGEPQYQNPELLAKHGWCLGFVGDWAVICTDCSKTHRTAVLPIERKELKA